MVLMNASKKSRLMTSTMNQPQGGGNKKAGLVPTMAMTERRNIAYQTRHLPQSMAVMKMNLYTNVRQSRPIYIRPTNYKP